MSSLSAYRKRAILLARAIEKRSRDLYSPDVFTRPVHGREYRRGHVISFHRGRSRSAKRLGCVPPRWKFWPSKRKTVGRGETSRWKRDGSNPASKRREANRLSDVKRPGILRLAFRGVSRDRERERDCTLLLRNFPRSNRASWNAPGTPIIGNGPWRPARPAGQVNFLIIDCPG